MLSQTNFFFKLENVWNFCIAYASSRNQNFGNWRFNLLPAACDSTFAMEIDLILSMITKVISKKKILSPQRGHLCRTYSYPEFRAGLGQDSGSLPIFNKITEGEGKKCELVGPFMVLIHLSFSQGPQLFSHGSPSLALFPLTTLPHTHSFSSTFGCFWRRHLQ